MKSVVTILSLALVTSTAFADGKCYLQSLDSNGAFAGYLIKAEGLSIPEGAMPTTANSADGSYSIEVTKMTQANMSVDVKKDGKFVMQTMTVGLNSNFQWVRSSAVLNADGSGLSLWCSFSN